MDIEEWGGELVKDEREAVVVAERSLLTISRLSPASSTDTYKAYASHGQGANGMQQSAQPRN